jgi:Na+-driven multidrug efflux pump
MLPGLLPNFLSEALRRYLQSQGVTMPIFISSTVVMFLSPVLGYLLIYTFGMGFAVRSVCIHLAAPKWC